jgi:hypothetical protein
VFLKEHYFQAQLLSHAYLIQEKVCGPKFALSSLPTDVRRGHALKLLGPLTFK